MVGIEVPFGADLESVNAHRAAFFAAAAGSFLRRRGSEAIFAAGGEACT